MPTLQATVEAYIRDLEHEDRPVVFVDTGPGITEDDGATVVIPLGYCPNIGTAAPADIKITLHPAQTVRSPAELVSRSDDVAAGTSTLTFTFQT